MRPAQAPFAPRVLELAQHQTIAHYRIAAKPGGRAAWARSGATDTKLGDNVAIKILPEVFAQDADRMTRFTRKVQLLAEINLIR
jgi:serine/threonine-protein kinase